jgi:Rrf2 family transcriptional regulator, iron-sulfur cluster assembly transcription factor
MLSNTCKYAVRALIYLAKFSKEGKMIGIKKISEDLKLSSPFLGKILQNLVKQKLLVSTKGPNGGFALAKHSSKLLCGI